MDLDLVCEAEAEATGPLISGGHKKCTLARMTKRDGGGSKDPYRSGLVKCWACSRHTHVNPKTRAISVHSHPKQSVIRA